AKTGHTPAAAQPGRKSGDNSHMVGGRTAGAWPVADSATSLSLAPSRDQRGRSSRRRQHAGTGGNQFGSSWRSVSRRAARIQPPHAGGAAATLGREQRDDLASDGERHIPRQLATGRRNEPLPVRISRRSETELPMWPNAD